jgi:hypothetical protein
MLKANLPKPVHKNNLRIASWAFGHGFVVQRHRGDMNQFVRHRRLFGNGQKHLGAFGQAVGETAGPGGQQDRGFTHLGMAAHAKRAAGHYEVAAVKPLQQRMLTLLD